MKLPLVIKANPLRFVVAIGATVTGALSFWVHPLVAAVLGIVSMLPTAWLVDRRIQHEIRRASDLWKPWP